VKIDYLEDEFKEQCRRSDQSPGTAR